MRYCGECGAQLKDDDIFCGECGTRQENIVTATQNQQNDVENVAVHLSEDILTASVNDDKAVKRNGIPGWVIIIALILCSPLILVYLVADWLLVLPEVLWWCVYLGFQIAALGMMWSKKSWHIGIKIGVLILYVLSYII